MTAPSELAFQLARDLGAEQDEPKLDAYHENPIEATQHITAAAPAPQRTQRQLGRR